MMEGFSGQFGMVVDMVLFLRFMIWSLELVISHLQYMDNNLILVENLDVNLWTIKAIFRVFSLPLGYMLIFLKASTLGLMLTQI